MPTLILDPVKRFFRRVSGLVTAPNARARLGEGTQPFCNNFGYTRGHPISRYYLDQFLREFRDDIRGHCLEFQEGGYAATYGQDRVTKLDILHIDDTNPQATIVADLTKPNDIPGDRFDCIICTHVLHVILELDKAISELHRILKPGGVLLVASPHISMADIEWHEIWRYTAEGQQRMLEKAFGTGNVTARYYGNSLTAAGYIRGLATEDFTQAELDCHDERFAVEVCARAVKGR